MTAPVDTKLFSLPIGDGYVIPLPKSIVDTKQIIRDMFGRKKLLNMSRASWEEFWERTGPTSVPDLLLYDVDSEKLVTFKDRKSPSRTILVTPDLADTIQKVREAFGFSEDVSVNLSSRGHPITSATWSEEFRAANGATFIFVSAEPLPTMPAVVIVDGRVLQVEVPGRVTTTLGSTIAFLQENVGAEVQGLMAGPYMVAADDNWGEAVAMVRRSRNPMVVWAHARVGYYGTGGLARRRRRSKSRARARAWFV